MIDMASPAREKIRSAIRAFTSASVAEAEAATFAIIRIIQDNTPETTKRHRTTIWEQRAAGQWHPGDDT